MFHTDNTYFLTFHFDLFTISDLSFGSFIQILTKSSPYPLMTLSLLKTPRPHSPVPLMTTRPTSHGQLMASLYLNQTNIVLVTTERPTHSLSLTLHLRITVRSRQHLVEYLHQLNLLLKVHKIQSFCFCRCCFFSFN